MSPVGRITFVAHLETRSTCGKSWIDWSVTFARFGTVGRRSLTRPPSSLGDTSAFVCVIHGNDAATVAGVSWTPGRISFENARSGGNVLFRWKSALSAFVRRLGRMWRLVFSAVDWLANAPIVRLKLVTRPVSADS